MALIPYAGKAVRDERGRFQEGANDFKDLALFSLRSELANLRKKYRDLQCSRADLQRRLRNARARIEFLDTKIRRASVALGGSYGDTSMPFIKNAELIVDIVAAQYGITPAMLYGRTRNKDATFPRHVAMYLIEERLGITKSNIGRFFCGRDHTTVIHAAQKIKRAVGNDPAIAATINIIQEKLNENIHIVPTQIPRGEDARAGHDPNNLVPPEKDGAGPL